MNQVNINEEEQVENKGMGAEQIKLSREELAVEDQDLKEMFIILTHSSLLQTESREKLPKPNSDNQLKESANRVLDIYLKEVDTTPGICDKIYTMGRAIVFKLRNLAQGGSGERKNKSAIGGNRQKWKLKKLIQELHQIVAKASNELYRRRQWRKAPKKEKQIIKKLSLDR